MLLEQLIGEPMQTTLMTEEQIWGSNALDIMKDYGTQTGITDLAIALGGWRSDSYTDVEGDYTCYPWSASATCNGNVRVVNNGGDKDN